MSKYFLSSRQLSLIVILGLFLGLTACGLIHPMQYPENAVPVRTNTVKIVNFAFMPSRIIVGRGQQVTWTNYDSAPHTVTSNNNIFDSGKMMNGQMYSYVFKRRGIYYYHCVYHHNMSGIVEVR